MTSRHQPPRHKYSTSTASTANGSPAASYTSSYQRASTASLAHAASPSRIPRPPLSSPATNASYASPRSPSRRESTASVASRTTLGDSTGSRKRARPMSPTVAYIPSYTTPSYAISPFTPAASAGWSHVTAAHVPMSPPPMVNMQYELKGGMDTPSLVAERRYEGLGDSDYMGDRGRRDEWSFRGAGDEDDDRGILGGDKNGRGRTIDEDVDMDGPNAEVGAERPQTGGWGGFMLGALGTVVAGAWAFCKKSAFHGFHAGGGQGYDIGRVNGADDQFASESMWEDERDEIHQKNTPRCTRSFSFERLPTPVPGGYPGDSPPLEEEYQRVDYERRPSKRRQTDGGGWIMIDKKENTPSRTSSPRLSTPSATTRPHLRTQSASVSRRSLMSASRHRRRISATSVASSPAPTPSARPSSRRSSYIQPRSPPLEQIKQTSPLSVEAKKYVSRRRKEDREAEERYDRLNDRLKEMIKQGKEALGTKVEIVEDEEIW